MSGLGPKIRSYPYDPEDGRELTGIIHTGGSLVKRGGSFNWTFVDAIYRSFEDPFFSNFSDGFRCAIGTTPVITSPEITDMIENQTSVIDVESTDDNDSEGAGLTYSITGGADQSFFRNQ